MFILACILRTLKPQTLVSAFLKNGCSKWSNKLPLQKRLLKIRVLKELK